MSDTYDEKKYMGGAPGQAPGETLVGEPVYGDEGVGYEGIGAHKNEGLKRQLKSRHIAMISIGGVIGTGLFLGTATALKNGGPLGLLLGYMTMGSVCYCVMCSMGEMVAYLPLAGGHIKLAERFVDSAFSAAMGWNYWYNWLIIMPAELSAAAILINYWNDSINNALWISICLIVVVAINLAGAGVYGECEFWFASIKVLTITGLIILSIILAAGGGPDHKAHGFEYWRNPGAWGVNVGSKAQFLGYFAVLSQAAFSFIGTEIVAIAAGEAKNPRKNIPKAIKRVYIRILLFYILGTLCIGISVPANYPGLTKHSNAAGSPFVIAINRAGIKALPSIINACLLTSAWSAASSDLYTSSRALYGLAITRRAPKIFAKTTKSGLPWVSLILCAAFGGLAYTSLSTSANNVFGYLANLTSGCGLITWWSIAFTYVRFYKGMKVQGIDRKTLPYWSYINKGAFGAWYSLVLITIILFFFSWQIFKPTETGVASTFAPDFITNYGPQILFPLIFLAFKIFTKSKFIRASEMDFYSDIAQIEAEEEPEEIPTTWIGKFWGWLM